MLKSWSSVFLTEIVMIPGMMIGMSRLTVNTNSDINTAITIRTAKVLSTLNADFLSIGSSYFATSTF